MLHHSYVLDPPTLKIADAEVMIGDEGFAEWNCSSEDTEFELSIAEDHD